MQPRATRSLSNDVEAPGRARAMVGALGGALAERVAEDARLLVSEIVTDRVLHGRGDTIDVELEALAPGRMRCRVGAGPGRRGLLDGGLGREVVDAVATSWGVTADGDEAWFEIRRPAPVASPQSAS